MPEGFHRHKSKRPVEQPLGVWLIILWQAFAAALIPIVFIVISLVKPSAIKTDFHDPWVVGGLIADLVVLGICIAAAFRLFWARYALAGLVAFGCIAGIYVALNSASDADVQQSNTIFSSLLLMIPFRLIITVVALVYLLAGSSSRRFFSRGH
jgi:hypothetical protein